MKNIPFIAAAIGALSAAALGWAGAATAAPSGPPSVEQTVNRLQAGGYTVIVNKVGAAPLGQCTLAGIRPGQTYSQVDSGVPGAQNDFHASVRQKTVYVDVAC